MINTMTEKISVIIPVYNAEKFIAATLLNVINSYENLEIICVNDGSTDETASILQAYEGVIKIIQLTNNKGVSFARNVGIQHSTGLLISFLDADDLYPPNKLQSQVEFLQMHKEIDVVWGLTKYIFLEEKERNYYPSMDADTAFSVNVGAAMFRRTVFDKIGFFDDTLAIAEDLDLYNRITHFNVPFSKVDIVWLNHQRHSNSLMRNKAAIAKQQTIQSLHKFINFKKQSHTNESN